MPRQIVVFALAVILVACAKEAEKPVESPATQQTAQTAVADTSGASETEVAYEEEGEEFDTTGRAERGALDRIHRRLLDIVYPMGGMADKTGVTGEFTWVPDNIHVVARENDSLVLASFIRESNGGAHYEPGYLDLVAAQLKNGRFKVLATQKGIASGEFGNANGIASYSLVPSFELFLSEDIGGAGFCRLGENVWAWLVGSRGGAQEFHTNTITVYALIDNRIRNLGSYEAGQRNGGKYMWKYHMFNSWVTAVDELHPTVSDLAITWYHSYCEIDSNRRMTVHRYRSGKGYDFSNAPYRRCSHDTDYYSQKY